MLLFLKQSNILDEMKNKGNKMTIKYILDNANKMCYEIQINEKGELNSFEVIGNLGQEFSFSAKNLTDCESFDSKEEIMNKYPEYFV